MYDTCMYIFYKKNGRGPSNNMSNRMKAHLFFTKYAIVIKKYIFFYSFQESAFLFTLTK